VAKKVGVDGVEVPVVEKGERPVIFTDKGKLRITGKFQWTVMPQGLRIPPAIGILSLTVSGKLLENPTWDAQGQAWFRQKASGGPAAKGFCGLENLPGIGGRCASLVAH